MNESNEQLRDLSTKSAIHRPDSDKKTNYLITKKLPGFDWLKAYDKAVSDGTYFQTWDEFKAFLCKDEHAVFIEKCLYYEIALDEDFDGIYEPAIWYIGNGPDNDSDGKVSWAEIHDLETEKPWEVLGVGVIIHGTVAVEGDFVSPMDNGFHIYGNGFYDVTRRNDLNGNGESIAGYGNNYYANRIPELKNGQVEYFMGKSFESEFIDTLNPLILDHYVIPYNLPALVAGGNIYLTRGGPIPSKWAQNELPKLIADSSGLTSYSFIHGTVFAGERVFINAENISGSIFLTGNVMGSMIRIEGWTHLNYDESVMETENWWIW